MRLYPGASFETIYDPQGHHPILYLVVLAPQDVAAVQGLELIYSRVDQPVAASHAEVIDAEVTDQAFLSLATSSVSGDTLAANWSGVLYAPAYGSYRLLLRGPAGATLVIDGETLVVLQKDGELFASQVLAQGNHQLQVQHR